MCLNSDRRMGMDLRYKSHCASWYSFRPSSVSILTGEGSHASGGRPPTLPPPFPTAVSGTFPTAVRSYGDALMSCTHGGGGGAGGREGGVGSVAGLGILFGGYLRTGCGGFAEAMS